MVHSQFYNMMCSYHYLQEFSENKAEITLNNSEKWEFYSARKGIYMLLNEN